MAICLRVINWPHWWTSIVCMKQNCASSDLILTYYFSSYKNRDRKCIHRRWFHDFWPKGSIVVKSSRTNLLLSRGTFSCRFFQASTVYETLEHTCFLSLPVLQHLAFQSLAWYFHGRWKDSILYLKPLRVCGNLLHAQYISVVFSLQRKSCKSVTTSVSFLTLILILLQKLDATFSCEC
jgi:hypothetical protein